MSARLEAETLELPGVTLLSSAVHTDARGFLIEVMALEALRNALADPTLAFVQINHSHNTRHALRGLHWQVEQPQGKLVVVVAGRLLDVVVDLRRDSPTRLRHVCVPLAAGTGRALWIPAGYAHGFVAGEEGADVLYACTSAYRPACGRGVRWNDPDLGIDWGVEYPVLSASDAALPLVRELRAGDFP